MEIFPQKEKIQAASLFDQVVGASSPRQRGRILKRERLVRESLNTL